MSRKASKRLRYGSRLTPWPKQPPRSPSSWRPNPDGEPKDILEVDKVINNGYADVPTIVTPITMVNKDNLDDTIIAGGFYTRDEVYGSN